MAFTLAAHFPMFHGQVSHVRYPRRQFIALATSLYVLCDNLFHVGAENPFRPLLVGTRNLLVERRLSESAGAALFYAQCHTLQFRQIRTRDHQIVAAIRQQRLVRSRRRRPWIRDRLQSSLRPQEDLRSEEHTSELQSLR